MKRVFLLLTVVVVIVSCQKEVSFDDPSGGGGTGGGGGGTTSDTYQPVTKDSYWKYQDSGFTGQTTLMTATGQTQTINGKLYYVVKSETTGQAPATGYFHASKPWYGLRMDVNNGIATTIEFLHLNDTASVGFTWDNTMPPVNGFNARVNGKMIARNISKTVAGKSYSNVMHTEMTLEYELPVFGWMQFATYNYYTAKGIGIIRIESDLTFMGQTAVRAVSDLIEYSIK